MNKQTQKGLVALGILGVIILGYLGYKKSQEKKQPQLDSKKIVITYLDNLFGVDVKHTDFVNSAGKNYIDAWALAITQNQPTFVADGVTYNTNGGTKK